MKATGAVKWRTHLALLFVLVLGIVLSPLRAVAATIPALFAYDVAIQGTATAPLGRIYAVPPERGGLPEYAYDAAHVGYDGTVNPQAVARAVATRAYGPTLNFLNRREVGEGVIYDALAATAAAEAGGTAITRGEQVTEEVIRNAMKDAPLSSQQAGGVSLPRVQQYVDKLLAGEVPPAIKVDGSMIVDGNHRYIAGQILGQDTPVIQWLGGRPGSAVPWSDIPISPEAW
jgi:hypothetical protein